VPSYLQLAQEQVWQDQYVPDNLTTLLIDPLRAFYSMGAASIGAPGDNNHLYGRHRSADWDRSSAFCTNRSYGTTDARDHGGDQNIYRAVDVGIQGEVLYAASHRVDELVRSGAAPGVAEWFGTFDGVNVVGWYEGGPSSSDDSHLWHLHVGFWNSSAEDPATLQAVLAAITGEDMADYGSLGPPPNEPEYAYAHPDVMLADLHAALVSRKTGWGGADSAGTWALFTDLAALNAKLDQVLAALAGGVEVSAKVGLTDEAIAAVADATADELAADPERDGAGT